MLESISSIEAAAIAENASIRRRVILYSVVALPIAAGMYLLDYIYPEYKPTAALDASAGLTLFSLRLLWAHRQHDKVNNHADSAKRAILNFHDFDSIHSI